MAGKGLTRLVALAAIAMVACVGAPVQASAAAHAPAGSASAAPKSETKKPEATKPGEKKPGEKKPASPAAKPSGAKAVPKVSISISSDKKRVAKGGIVTFTITVKNDAQSELQQVALVEEVQGGTPQSASDQGQITGLTVTWPLTIPPGASVTRTSAARFSPPDSTSSASPQNVAIASLMDTTTTPQMPIVTDTALVTVSGGGGSSSSGSVLGWVIAIIVVLIVIGLIVWLVLRRRERESTTTGDHVPPESDADLVIAPGSTPAAGAEIEPEPFTGSTKTDPDAGPDTSAGAHVQHEDTK